MSLGGKNLLRKGVVDLVESPRLLVHRDMFPFIPVPTQDGCRGARNERGQNLFHMVAESVSRPPGQVKLSTEYLPPETLERSKVGNKFEKTKCKKPGDVLWTEVR